MKRLLFFILFLFILFPSVLIFQSNSQLNVIKKDPSLPSVVKIGFLYPNSGSLSS